MVNFQSFEKLNFDYFLPLLLFLLWRNGFLEVDILLFCKFVHHNFILAIFIGVCSNSLWLYFVLPWWLVMLNVLLCAYLPSVYLLCKISVHVFCCCLEAKLYLCDSMDCSLPGSSFHGISQARVLEWTAISVSNGPSFVFYPFLNKFFFLDIAEFWVFLNYSRY